MGATLALTAELLTIKSEGPINVAFTAEGTVVILSRQGEDGITTEARHIGAMKIKIWLYSYDSGHHAGPLGVIQYKDH